MKHVNSSLPSRAIVFSALSIVFVNETVQIWLLRAVLVASGKRSSVPKATKKSMFQFSVNTMLWIERARGRWNTENILLLFLAEQLQHVMLFQLHVLYFKSVYNFCFLVVQ